MKKPSPEQIHAFFFQPNGCLCYSYSNKYKCNYRILRVKKPKRVLELGGGIGTLTYCVLNYSEAIVEVYEENGFL